MKNPAEFSIEVNGLSVAYEHKRVLSNIYLKIEAGLIYGLIGPNGAGKSTLFKSILQEVPISSGEIKILGSPAQDMLTHIAYVPQKDDVDWQFPATVYDIVSMGRFPHKKLLERMHTKDHEIISYALEQLDIVKLKDKQIGELSGGQQQRVFLARALCQQADILLMDEPFVGVDIKTEKKIIEIMKQLAADGKTVMVVHHDLDSVLNYFDRVILINQKLMAYGDTQKVFTKENISATYSSQSNLLQYTAN
ncbi:MAG: metal ABC transporter ATP-binding protein [Saprospiraceae bacterium]|nr:metal ABC transporter ATP-binding protein [Saprospiraceae bacterium]MBK8450673.1 metal ABC transporter ATP-binding protein [Saprospiraceae bacterium]MBK8485249.1 metal ABC transporter ATP-binding protein [Saprospiraceae bacterium]MBK9222465.1 metal ABC transporter ATP-binding protein [Saprospiraceae bacterium]MBK9720500.1 metal ABC transporter ATP-binding protein [Saprospiraceae bacterium]